MSTETEDCTKYNKRSGTSGIRGHLYETKLISLIHFRAIHDDSIEEIHLATNVDQIGALDDICFKAKVKGFDKPVAVFIQAKHRENEKQMLKIDLAECFKSYLKIRHIFESNSEDPLFKGKFDETECLFVMYTTASDEFENEVVESSFASKLNDLIGTDSTAKQPYKNKEDVVFLCKIAVKEEMIALAGQMAKLICDEVNLQMLLCDELVLRYHLILAQKVIDISEIRHEEHQIASLRQDFFDTNEEFLIVLKDTLYVEILKKRELKETDIQVFLTDFLKEPSVTTLSKLVGTVITYNKKSGQLELVGKMSTAEDYKQQLNKVYVSQVTVNKAIELAAKEMLSSPKFKDFKVPTAFGNKDLTLGGSDKKVERRLKHLTLKISDLLDKSRQESNNIVTIDESLENGLLQLNGGIAGAVGNLLVPDENTKLMKFTENCELLGDLAKRLFVKLKSKTSNLHEYKFNCKIQKFPKLSFDRNEYDENLAKDFLNKLLFYTNQADEKGVEDILKNEIEDNERDHVDNFQIRNDAIFLKYHDEIQKWWMIPKQAKYLTKDRKMFEDAKNNIMKEPLMSIINMMYMYNKIQQINYTFKEDALKSLKLQDQHLRTVIITESSALTVVKVLQCLTNKDHVVLDLEYILNLPRSDRNALCTELTNANNEKILIFICDEIQNSRKGSNKTLEYFTKAVNNKKTIVITNQMSVGIIKKYFLQAENEVVDEKNNLIDMSEETQESFLKTTSVIFQGKEVSLDLIVDDESMAFVNGVVLNKIINKETIVVSKPLGNSNYDEIKHLYIDRRVKKTEDHIDIVIKTLYDIIDDVVLITAIPGMGKSTLLTHLSLKTKEKDPKVWIVRINLLEYSSEFSKWKKANTDIDTLETLNFMCQVLLREKLGKENEVKIELDAANGVVQLKECTGDQWTVFELKLFLHFFNRKKLIILFDGFDEICPHYMNVVIKCLKTVGNYPGKHRMWVTSRSYNDVKTVLKREFGTFYEIEHFSYYDKEKYLEKFWKSNLILEEFNREQLENVYEFLEFTSKTQYRQLLHFEFLLHDIYMNVSAFLINEIENKYLPLWTWDTFIYGLIDFSLGYYVYEKENYNNHKIHITDSDGTPLHLYLIAEYIENQLKQDKLINEWNLDINTFNIYETFLETKLKKIRFQEKNKMDIYNPDNMISYEKERTDFMRKHKKLAAYGIFHQHRHKLFDRETLKRIKDNIKFIEQGGEKTGVINSIANGIPIFVHMTFTEYFAVEYVCDLLKSENRSAKLKSWLDFIFNVMFSISSFNNVRVIFDHKMKYDNELMSVLEKNKKIMFKLLLKQGKVHYEYCVNLNSTYHRENEADNELEPNWSLSVAAFSGLHNFMCLCISILQSYLSASHFNDFLKYFLSENLFAVAVGGRCDELLIFIIDIIRKFDESKLIPVLNDNIIGFCPEISEFTTEDMVAFIRS